MSRIGLGVVTVHGPRYSSSPRTGQAAQGAHTVQPKLLPLRRLTLLNRRITCGQALRLRCAGASAQLIAASVVSRAQREGCLNAAAALSSPDPSPRSAAARFAAFSGHVSGVETAKTCETSMSP